MEEFYQYLKNWEKCVEERTGFSKTEKGTMLLSVETQLGLKMDCK